MKIAPQEIRTFFVTSVSNLRRPIFKNDLRARLILDVLQENRKLGRFFLHEFVVMPDHFHLILTPAPNISLERAAQFIKGGFSFRAAKELGFRSLVWQEGFAKHRLKDADDYATHRRYIYQNPVKAMLVKNPEEYPYSSAFPGMKTDEVPPGLKPQVLDASARP
ncbi:MAG TPA: transposase [Candidatus Angelobacter sp.]|nr:transposase [Candidatus Angelobacter sp.]